MPTPSDVKVDQSTYAPTSNQSQAGTQDISMVKNEGYNVPVSYVTHDHTKKRGIRPTAEAVKYASTVPNSLQFRPRQPRQLDIYNTPPPDVEIRELPNSPSRGTDNPLSDEDDDDAEFPIDISPTEVDNSGHPPSDAEGSYAEGELTPGGGNECDEYFPTASILTKDSPAYNAPIHHPAEGTAHRLTTDNTSAPTPEPKSFTSMWTSNAQTEPEAADSESQLDHLRITETPV